MAIYNDSFMDNSTNILEYTQGINTLTDGWLFAFIVILIFLLLLVVFQQFDFLDNMIITSFITSISAAFFYSVNLFPVYGLVILVIILLGSVFIKVIQ